VIPSVTHVDGSARPQTVEKKINALYWRLIDEFGKCTGVPAIMNTSFNLRGEAIVLAAEKYEKPEFVNSGAGEEIGIRDLLEQIRGLAGTREVSAGTRRTATPLPRYFLRAG
jgi:hypothetical protein